jgi:hypothetical protein
MLHQIVALGQKGGSAKTTTAILTISAALDAGLDIGVIEVETEPKIEAQLTGYKDRLQHGLHFFAQSNVSKAYDEIVADPLYSVEVWDGPRKLMETGSFVMDTGAAADAAFLGYARSGAGKRALGSGEKLAFLLPFTETPNAAGFQCKLANELRQMLPEAKIFLVGVGIGEITATQVQKLNEKKIGAQVLRLPKCMAPLFDSLMLHDGLITLLAAHSDASLTDQIAARHSLSDVKAGNNIEMISQWAAVSQAALAPVVKTLLPVR